MHFQYAPGALASSAAFEGEKTLQGSKHIRSSVLKMAPIDLGIIIKNGKDVSQVPCGVAFAGSYPPLFCLQGPKPSDTIRARELGLSNDAATGTSPNATVWPAGIQEAIHEPRTWIAGVVILFVLISAVSLCYQCCKGVVKRRGRRNEEIAARRLTEEGGIDLPSTPRSNAFMKFKQRKERRAAEQRAQRQQEQAIGAPDGVQTPGIVVNERELHDSEKL